MISRNHQQGLTRIELLIVIAIAAALVGLLFTWGSGDHRRKAKYALCSFNLRQITTALSLYAQGNANKFPNFDLQPGNDGPVALILLTNYAQFSNTFMCPLVQRPPALDRAFFHDYAYYDGLSTDSVSSPSTTAIMADRYPWVDRSRIYKWLLNHPDRSVNVSFIDGHVEHAQPKVLIGTNLTPAWSGALDPLRMP